MAVLRCSNLVKRYSDVVAVDGLDLEVSEGECFGLLGPNGAGKTTTTEILEGLTPPTSGQVQVLGQTWGGTGDRRLRERLGVALQETRLTDKLTVEETLRLFRSFYPKGRDVDEVIQLLGMVEKRRARVEKLSGGQRQRLALACALVGTPDILFLDEPTTGLDPQARLAIWEVIERFTANKGTVFLTTHYMEEASRLCDRVGIMDHGKLIALDKPEALIDSLNAEQIIELNLDNGHVHDSLLGVSGVCSVEHQGETMLLKVKHLQSTLPAVLAELTNQGAFVNSMITRQATLEDVFVHMTGRALRDE